MNRVLPRSRQLPPPPAKMDQFSLDGDEGGVASKCLSRLPGPSPVRPLQSIQLMSQGRDGECKIVSRQNDGGGAISSCLHFKIYRVGRKLNVKQQRSHNPRMILIIWPSQEILQVAKEKELSTVLSAHLLYFHPPPNIVSASSLFSSPVLLIPPFVMDRRFGIAHPCLLPSCSGESSLYPLTFICTRSYGI